MELHKKKSTKQYNLQKSNDVTIRNNYVHLETIVHELRNININEICDGTESDLIWNTTKETVNNNATKILGMEPKENKKNWFNDILCKNAMVKRNESRICMLCL